MLNCVKDVSVLCRSSGHFATNNAIYLHMQSTSSPARTRTGSAAAAASSSAQTSVSSVTRTGLDDDDDDDDDEVCMINRHGELVDVDSGLVPDLLSADDAAPACRLLLLHRLFNVGYHTR